MYVENNCTECDELSIRSAFRHVFRDNPYILMQETRSTHQLLRIITKIEVNKPRHFPTHALAVAIMPSVKPDFSRLEIDKQAKNG